MESNNPTLPSEYLSVNRYIFVILITIFLTLSIRVIWDFFFGYDASVTIAAFFELIGTIPAMILVQLFLGWIIWVPMALIALILGMPVWIVTVRVLIPRGLTHRLSIVCATLIVVLMTAVCTDLFLLLSSDSEIYGNDLAVLMGFSPFAAVIACLSTHFMYRSKQ